MSPDLLPSILSTLDIAVFEETSNGQFLPVCDLPDWYQDIYNDSPSPKDDTSINLGETSPFLENFFIDASKAWATPSLGKLSSGVWTEIDFQNKQHQLEAYAFNQGDKHILILMDLSLSFRDRHHVYQRAREIALENEKLSIALQHRQRKLQSVLEKKVDSESLDQVSQAVENNTSAVLICEQDGSIQVFNKALMDIYHIHPDKPAEKQSLLNKWIKEAEDAYPEIKRVVASGSYWEGEFESADLLGIKKWVRLAIGPVINDAGSISHYVCIANDISEIRKSSLELERLTDYDLTTHLPNRHHFWKIISSEIGDGLKNHSMLALFYIDLDHFKRVNESLGHHAGDFMLNTLASRLNNHIKGVDFIAHLGGDEFAIIADIGHESQVDNIAARLLDEINQPVHIETNQLKISASIGIAIFPQDGEDATTLMKHADLAMFHAKELGRNQFQTFNTGINTKFISRLNLENDLVSAIELNQFKLLYQPQICIEGEQDFRVEALIRWRHPERGLISPANFIPLAEESGQIHEIGKWVLETACLQAKQFFNQGYNVIVAVNVSACQARKDDFIDIVESTLSKTGLSPKQLEVEITETSLLEEMDTVITMLSKLRREGITVSLDDFGSGFSSLNYLKSLPVDNLKIDQSFVKELSTNDESKAITSSVIRLAHELRMNVIAEGVETEDQLNFLRNQGCDYVQGYLFYRPIEAEDLKEAFDKMKAA